MNFNHNPFQIRLFLTQHVTQLLVQAVIFPTEYCNGCADVVQNATVRLIFIRLKQAQIELLFSPVLGQGASLSSFKKLLKTTLPIALVLLTALIFLLPLCLASPA